MLISICFSIWKEKQQELLTLCNWAHWFPSHRDHIRTFNKISHNLIRTFFSALLLILFACLFGFNENAYHICTVHMIRAITRWYNKFKSFHLNFYIRVHAKIGVFSCSLEFWLHIKFKAMQMAHRKFVYMSRIFFLDLKCRWFSLIKKKEKEMPLRSSGWMHCICKRRYLSMKLIEYGILLMRDQCRHST